MNKIAIYFSILFLSVLSLSCSKDDEVDTPSCQETNIVMTLNGEQQNFDAVGRGIDLISNGYILHLNLDRRGNNPYWHQTVFVELPFQTTGKNIIETFNYSQYIDGESFSRNLVEGQFESDVIINSKNCFYATFSGKFYDGNQEVEITDGIISYEYETPFTTTEIGRMGHH